MEPAGPMAVQATPFVLVDAWLTFIETDLKHNILNLDLKKQHWL